MPTCKICGVELQPSRSNRWPIRQLCSSKCSNLSFRRSRPGWSSVISCACEGCGTEIYRSRVGSRGKKRFCSEKCRTRHRYLRVNSRPEKPCVRCGAVIPAGAHVNRDHCTRQCKKDGDAERVAAIHIERYRTDARYREMFHRNGHIRRARLKGVSTVRFDPLTVLERDGWICQICGVSTPKELRGVKVHNSPTLDHVVPIAKGGAHTPENTQCACLRCNCSKGARMRAA
jgi:hypothetical protein